MTASEAEAICDRIQSTDAIARSREHALGFVAASKDLIAQIDLGPQQRKALELVADGVVERYS